MLEQHDLALGALHAELDSRADRIAALTTEIAVLHGRLQEATTLVDQLNKQTLRLHGRNVRLRAGVPELADEPSLSDSEA